MKKAVFSPVTKIIAFVLTVALMVLGVNSAIDTITRYMGEEEQIYDFETSFDETGYFYWLLKEPALTVTYALDAFLTNGNEDSLYFCLEKELKDMPYSDKIMYSITLNGIPSTNCWEEREYFEQSRFFCVIEKNERGELYFTDSNGTMGYDHWLIDKLDWISGEFEICVSVEENYVLECEKKWQEQADYVWKALIEVAVYAGVMLLLMIYLLSVIGKKADGEVEAMWIDSVWTEIHLALIGGAGVGATVLCVALLENYGQIPLRFIKLICLAAVGLAGALIINSLLSLVRKIKCKKFLETSVIFIVLRWIFKTLRKILKFIGNRLYGCARLFYRLITKKSGVLLITVMLVYAVIMAVCGACLTDDDTAFVGIALGLILVGFVCVVLAHRGKELDSVKEGIREIKRGNLTYNIPELKSSDLNTMAQDINEIALGFDESVSAKVKAERMKTELITNVSHDLKTPLTSIVNYTELLNNVENLPEEAKDYVRIIAKKSERLKRLTQDLFDISKIQSGNEEITFERIDVSLLVAQTLGENDSEIKKSELNFCVNLEKELCICADGRKVSRVIENLMSNVLKYAMKNTRVFVTTSTQGDNAVVEFKNTSAYPMDFDAQEIIGRFVRGDKSRSVEGNGLGLAIVQSYTDACGGKFEVITDGDLFKAILSFPKIK